MEVPGVYRWSPAALGAWLARAGLALLFAAAMVFGLQLADGAWDRGIHVTPAQAAMHAALVADGITHHHGSIPAREAAAVAGSRTSLQSPGPGTTWGTPFTQALQPELPAAMAAIVHMLVAGDDPRPPSVDLNALSPPPKL